jgi:uncharacterized protein (TIGR02302 family)
MSMANRDPMTPDPITPDPSMARVLARKLRLSKWALFFERLWPRLWVLIGLAALFVALSLAGIWPHVPELSHKIILALFALAGVASLVFALRVPWPSRDESMRRIERRSGVPHRPASSYEDTLSAQSGSAETSALWQAHRARLSAAIQRLKVGSPSPRADRFDPLAVRALALLILVPAALLATGSFSDRLASAFRFGVGELGPQARLDAWVTPPPYTALPPVLLADGGAVAGAANPATSKLIEVPERSLLTLRGIGFSAPGVKIEILGEGATGPEIVNAEAPKAGDTSGLSEVRFEIKRSAIIRALNGSRELAQWTFGVIPDQLPRITLDKQMDRTPRGSLKLGYKAEDDYGVQSAVAKFRQPKVKEGDKSKAWARLAPLKGPRLPPERPPVLTLKIPRPGEKAVEASTLLDLGEHPLAGQRVEMWLEATDVGGQIGRSEPVEIVLPSRRFNKPLARAVIEQRRKLAEDSRHRPMVARALDALTIAPEGFIEPSSIYLGLRAVHHRLAREGRRSAIKESIDHLWQLALRIEDGALSEAERALKDAQDKLADALQKGAEDKEIQDLIAELKQKLNDYLQEMEKNAQKDQPQSDPNGDQEQQRQDQLGQQDLDQMMKDLEKTAKEGSREEAEKMLADLKELMERLQSANSPEAKAEQKRAQDMMKKLDQLSDLAGQQQKLMDDTFKENNKPPQDGDAVQSDRNSGDKTGKQQRQGQSGQQGQQRGEQSDQGPPSGQELGGDQQAEGEPGQGKSGKNGNMPNDPQTLKERQAQLRKNLEQLKKDLEEMGAGDPDKLGKAEEAMGEAEEALKEGDFEEAGEQQAQALEQMRQSAQAMAQEMQENAQQKVGRGGDSPRDPLGRPQRSQGPDLGTSVKVPNAIDAQRAREILDELRKRAGENLRPPTELDYIERLLRRF